MKLNFKLSQSQKLVLALVVVCCLSSEVAMAQVGNGVTGLTAGTNEIKKYVKPVMDLTMVAGGIVGVIGAFRVFTKWNSGDNDINKEVMGWGGAMIFLIVSGIVVKAFFGV